MKFSLCLSQFVPDACQCQFAGPTLLASCECLWLVVHVWRRQFHFLLDSSVPAGPSVDSLGGTHVGLRCAFHQNVESLFTLQHQTEGKHEPPSLICWE